MKTSEKLEYQIDDLDIAIIGMAGRWPGAKTIEEFWHNLRDGVESISFFTDEELKSSGIDPSLLSNPKYVKAQPIIEDIDLFDASFFGFSPTEAEILDPQHRIFLECAWEAIESAGYADAKDSVGVYAGGNMSKYFLNLYSNIDVISAFGNLALLGNDKDYLSTKVSYKLNLKGPSYTIQTACSTSLVAVHVASQSLLNHECDMALAGGISLRVPQKVGYIYQEGDIMSPDGHCRAFDAQAKGTIFGSGVGIVVLKRLEDALADGDCIHAVIKGSAINNDGSAKVSYGAPSVNGQADVIVEALSSAGVEPDTISYIEAHGTGTSLGDPIEIAALTQAFRTTTQRKGFCAIGSVKTNLGHLDMASGVTGLIKTVLALKHKQIPPSLHFEQPNPQIDFANSPFYVNSTLSEWKTNGTPRRAGVSSFGMGGTNAHVIVQEPPTVESSFPSRKTQLLLLSAKTSTALETATATLAQYLQQHRDLNIADVAYTRIVGRRTFDHRRMVVCHDLDDAVQALSTKDPQRVKTHHQEVGNRPVVFMFPGQGAQYVNMARELYETEPTFALIVDRCCFLLKPHLGLDLLPVLYPSLAQAEIAAQQLKQTAITQAALFVIEYALAELWMSWGITPEATIGHSIGEYVAATIAGVFSLEDALAIVAARGQLMQQQPKGAMLSVQLSAASIEPLLLEELSIAAINAPNSCVVSGAIEAVEALHKQLEEKGEGCRRLHTSHAFHSPLMQPIIEPFTQLLLQVKLNPPKIPFISNVTGTWITPQQATDPNYWAQHLLKPVRFSSGIAELLKTEQRILLEVGPGRTLSTFALAHQTDKLVVLTSLRHPQEQHSDVAFLLDTLGKLWLSGVTIDWSGFYASEQRHRIPLPTYPFERQRYWIEPKPSKAIATAPSALLEKKSNIAEWFYIPVWKQSVPRELLTGGTLAEQKSCWLVFVDGYGIGEQIAARLEGENQDVITVSVGEQFTRVSDRAYAINPQQQDDCIALVQALQDRNLTPQTIAHFWSISPDETLQDNRLNKQFFDRSQHFGFYSLLFLAQALGQQNQTQPLKLMVVTSNLYDVTGDEKISPEKATVLGSCKVIPQEYPHITCCTVDLVIPATGTKLAPQLIDRLLAELTAQPTDLAVAYRGHHRWIQTFEAIELDESISRKTRLREGGVYLITGGLGGIGLAIAEYLAKTVQAKSILIGRKDFPDRNRWSQWLTTHDSQDPVSRKLRKVLALEELGAKVLVISADVTDRTQMQAAIDLATEHFGQIHGVIHAAGIAGGGMIQLKTPETAIDVLAPKVKGTLVLEDIFQNTELDFFVLCSSLTSILGGFGQVDYCAANAFLDAIAHSHASRYDRFTVSINWDTWQQVGMAVETAVPDDLKQLREQELKKGILPQEGVEAFSRILQSGLPQLVVSTQDFQAAIAQKQSFKSSSERLAFLEETLAQANLSKPTHSRPNLGNDYVAPRNEIEQKIADIWQQLLGIEEVGIYDNFFELGGHSLLLTQLLNRLHKTFKVDISMRSIFEDATVAGTSELILEKNVSGESSSEEKHIRELFFEAFPTERFGLVEEYLKNKIAHALNIEIEQLPANGKLHQQDLEAIASALIWDLKQDFQLPMYPHEILRIDSIDELARFIVSELEQISGLKQIESTAKLFDYDFQVSEKQKVTKRPLRNSAEKNPSMVFLLSSPRSGSTLLRLMLAGHPALFSPPELGLLGYESLGEKAEARTSPGLRQGEQWRFQGLQSAFIELMDIGVDESEALVNKLVAQNTPTKEVYKMLQQLAGKRLLVDKTPGYEMSMETLQRAEDIFEGAKYIYLVRHPYSVIESFVRNRFHALYQANNDIDPYLLAEKGWVKGNSNLLAFFKQLDPKRSHLIRYEELVREPARVMGELCEFIGIPFDEAILDPYDGKRMIGGLGDPNILQHENIDSSLGEVWKKIRLPRPLDEDTKQLAAKLKYELSEPKETSVTNNSVESLSEGENEEHLLAKIEQLSNEQVQKLLKNMLAEEEVGE